MKKIIIILKCETVHFNNNWLHLLIKIVKLNIDFWYILIFLFNVKMCELELRLKVGMIEWKEIKYNEKI